MKGMKGLFSGLVGLLCLVLLIVGAAIPIVVLVNYWVRLGDISGNPQDWSAFGSVMAGSFTFLAAIATTATFLVLIKQKKDSDVVVRRQLEALSFEQYVKHRALFMERLDALQDRFDGAFLFIERDYLYRRFFPMNRAVEVYYSAGESLHEFTQGLDAVWEKSSSFVEKPSMEMAEEICMALLSLFHKLGVEWQSPDEEGNVIYRGNYVGLNILSVASDLKRAFYIVEALVHFSGGQLVHPVTKVEPFGNVAFRDSFYKAVWDANEDPVQFKTNRDNRLHALYDLYEHVKSACEEAQGRFLGIYGILRDMLDGENGREYLASPEKMIKITDRCLLILSYLDSACEDEGGVVGGDVVREKILNLGRKMQDSLNG